MAVPTIASGGVEGRRRTALGGVGAASSKARHFHFKRSPFDDADQPNYLEGSQFDDPAPPPSLPQQDVKW